MSDQTMVDKNIGPEKYYRCTPGQKCERCGGDNSFRVKGTKYCYKCSHEVSIENAKKRRDYLERLKLRDTPGINPCCVSYLGMNYSFCPQCGKRLRKSKED